MASCRVCEEPLPTRSRYCPHCGEKRTDQPRQTVDKLKGNTILNSLLGGIVGFLSAAMLAALFTPFYVLGILTGGAVAGFMQAGNPRESVIVGVISALVATAPVILLIVPLSILGIGTIFGWMPWSMMGDAPMASGLVLIVIALFIMLLVFVTNIVFGVAGGAIGGALAESEGK